MKPSPEELARMSWYERATRALEEAVAGAIAEHKRLGLALVVWRDGKVVRISPEEAEADFNAARAAQRREAEEAHPTSPERQRRDAPSPR